MITIEFMELRYTLDFNIIQVAAESEGIMERWHTSQVFQQQSQEELYTY